MSLKLYCSDISPPVRAVYLCIEALGLKVEKEHINFFKGEQMNPEYKKTNPQHTVPTLVDDGFAIWDSHAINAYLVNKYGKDDSLYPKDPQKRAIVDQRLHFDSGVLFPRLRAITDGLFFRKCKEIPEEKKEHVRDAFAFLETFLEENDYLAGNHYTIADFCCVATVSTLVEGLSVSDEPFPKVKAWLQRCRDNLPGYKEANQPGLDIGLAAVNAELA